MCKTMIRMTSNTHTHTCIMAYSRGSKLCVRHKLHSVQHTHTHAETRNGKVEPTSRLPTPATPKHEKKRRVARRFTLSIATSTPTSLHGSPSPCPAQPRATPPRLIPPPHPRPQSHSTSSRSPRHHPAPSYWTPRCGGGDGQLRQRRQQRQRWRRQRERHS